MSLNTFDMSKINIFTLIRDAINAKMLIALGIIEKVMDDTNVIVSPLARDNPSVMPIHCSYVDRKSAVLQVSGTPCVGDIVLILSLNHYEDGMFDAKESLYRKSRNGYSLMTCIAIPIGTKADDAIFSVSVTEEDAVATSKKPVSLSVDGDHTDTATGVRSIEGSEIDLNGSSKSLVTGDLQSALTGLSNAINTELTKIAAAINALAPGSYVPSATAIDITSSLTTTIKTDG